MARKAKQVGALWRHEMKSEERAKEIFLTGTIDLGIHGEIAIAVFKNDGKKEGSKQPDYRIVLSDRNKNGGSGEGGDGSGLPF